jgi:hypothetical protein
MAVLFGAAAAKAATVYQVNIFPEIIPNFFGPGENAPAFFSTQFNLAQPPYPPEFSEIQLTFATSDLDFAPILADNYFTQHNLTVYMPEMNNQGPVAQGANLAPCNPSPGLCIYSYIFYATTLQYPATTKNTMFIDISDAGLRTGHEFQIHLDFPAGAGIGDATAVSIKYYTNDSNGDFTDYCPDGTCSASGGAISPEPASLAMMLMAGMAGLLLTRYRKRRM